MLYKIVWLVSSNQVITEIKPSLPLQNPVYEVAMNTARAKARAKEARVRQAREEKEKDSEVKEKVAREAEADLRVKPRAAASLRLIPARPSALPASRKLLTQGQ